MTIDAFLAQLKAIANEKPTYRLGGDGSDGTCDCIGLIIGACRRCGLRWPGIHGSNWSARNVTLNISRIPAASSLSLGDLVYKVRLPGSSRYNLPDRYADHYDDKDYYHVGVVTQVKPLRILHCTTPGVKEDKKLGTWKYFGQLSLVDGVEQDDESVIDIPATVRYGSRGENVTRLQLLLREEGYNLQPDGIFGPMTREAVRSYQSQAQLEVDGIVGPLTWRSLLS